MGDSVKVVRLEAENVKRLRAVVVEPKGAVTVIGGRNAQGKSSCLDALAMALGGKDLCPQEPIRKGADRAVVSVRLDDGTEIVRTFARKGDETVSKLEIRSAEGARYPSPQAMLDAMTSKIAFDPVAFLRLDARRQAEEVRRISGLDLSEHERRRKIAYDSRTLVNRDVRDLEGKLANFPDVEAPDDLVSMADLVAEERALNERRNRSDEAFRNLRSAEVAAARLRAEADRLELMLADIYKQQADMEAALEVVRENAEAAPPVAGEEYESINRRLMEAESINVAVRQKRGRSELLDRLEEARMEALGLSEEIDAIDSDRARLLAEARLPVPGLGFDGDAVTLGGLPLSQASSAEQLRLALAVGLSREARLKIVLIRDGSLLDDESLAIVAEMVEAAGAQALVESVGEGRASVVIEDGLVKDSR